jgi:hypothetical protein
MDTSAKRWMVYDRDSNPVYLTDERWQHIVDHENHPEMQAFEEHLKNTLRLGQSSSGTVKPTELSLLSSF